VILTKRYSSTDSEKKCVKKIHKCIYGRAQRFISRIENFQLGALEELMLHVNEKSFTALFSAFVSTRAMTLCHRELLI